MFPRFYPIVPDATWVERLARLGVKLIQLRIKDAHAASIPRLPAAWQ
jgi:thiamine-phosphate pyrophosphorylase